MTKRNALHQDLDFFWSDLLPLGRSPLGVDFQEANFVSLFSLRDSLTSEVASIPSSDLPLELVTPLSSLVPFDFFSQKVWHFHYLLARLVSCFLACTKILDTGGRFDGGCLLTKDPLVPVQIRCLRVVEITEELSWPHVFAPDLVLRPSWARKCPAQWRVVCPGWGVASLPQGPVKIRRHLV